MDASVTFRFPALARAGERENGISVTPAQPAGTLSIPSDEILLAGICDGDKEALASLFRRYARMVRGVAYRVLQDPSEADDLVQDIFLLVHRDCKKFDSSRGSAQFWILQMAYRRAISRRRHLTVRHFYNRVNLEDAASQIPDPREMGTDLEDSFDGIFGSGALKKTFDALSENQCQTLSLFFMEGYTLDEIAQRLGESRGNVKNHYFRGLDKLRKLLFVTKLPGGRPV
jgi:RNA polymerase sigma-70 factor (ECF subfamily)